MKPVLLLVMSAMAVAARPITERDLYRFEWVADPQISPDGTRVVFTRVKVNGKRDGYDTALWIVPAGGGEPRQLTSGPRDTSPRWSPDGARLAFLRAGETDRKPDPPQIFVLPMDGGEPIALTSLSKGASAPAWSPDGRTIAFASTSPAKEPEASKDGEGPSDVRVIRHAHYRTNDGGYTDFSRRPHVWTVAADAGSKPRPVTQGPYSEGPPSWSADGKQIYFVSNRELEPYYAPQDSDVYAVNAGGGEVRRVASVEGAILNFRVHPATGRLAFTAALTGKPERSYRQPDLFVTTTAGEARNLTEGYDYDIGAGLAGDQHPPKSGSAPAPAWSRDGRYVFTTGAEEGRANLKRVDAETGKMEPITEGDQEVYGFSVSADGLRAAVLISNSTRIGDLFLIDLASRTRRQLTNLNAALYSEVELAAPEMFWYQSFDGKRIQAWAQKPPGFDPSKKYPLILNIHGGPHAAYGHTFTHEFHAMAARGYIVLYPNPRGSTTYGAEFGNIIQYRYPGDDYKDLMAGVDELIGRGWVDPERMGVTGGSGGGLLTNWTITQTNRFKAAVSQRSIADWRDFWYTADFTQFTPFWFRGAPWEHEEDFRLRSPITYVERIKTPLMLIEGEADLRTPPAAGGEQLFRALKYLKRPVVMVQFPGESHELSRSGKPRHRVERLEHITGWMDKYVLGIDVKGYGIEAE